MSFSVIRIQTRVRGHLARCQLEQLKLEDNEKEALAVKNTSATTIVSRNGIIWHNFFFDMPTSN